MKKEPMNMDMTKPRKVVYHETDAPKGMMIYMGAEQEWYDKGWVNTPAKFGEVTEVKPEEAPPETDKTEIDPTTIEDASDLSDYLNEKYGMTTNFRMGMKKLKEILKGRLDDNSAEDN